MFSLVGSGDSGSKFSPLVAPITCSVAASTRSESCILYSGLDIKRFKLATAAAVESGWGLEIFFY